MQVIILLYFSRKIKAIELTNQMGIQTERTKTIFAWSFYSEFCRMVIKYAKLRIKFSTLLWM